MEFTFGVANVKSYFKKGCQVSEIVRLTGMSEASIYKKRSG
ncbi:hypothetical protein [Halodesulfovibrio marinisediminis]|uniref:Resolvase HTH domain-containing protein n=1 Tax=Halodesulfovibrio marinisediminis DSM 17456 TaxID=1121457 RepID=A0A1N6F8L0_9BACT|nr:hypothetical protein [Halodesulfovibrio marinisediminis]SIN91556.1 hypothetical protein SAMN02745161_1165 [Halodesulfovibrio marinisediminis DSM 17456]